MSREELLWNIESLSMEMDVLEKENMRLLNEIYKVSSVFESKAKAFCDFVLNDVGIIEEKFPYSHTTFDKIFKDRQEMAKSLALLFSVYHPRFVCFLEEKGLDEFEVGFCGLLILGFRNKEIGKILGVGATNNRSKKLRNKLGMSEDDPHLSVWLRNKYESYEETCGCPK